MFGEKRPVFQVPGETPKPPETAKPDQEALRRIGQSAIDKARRDAAVKAGAERAKSNPPGAPVKPGELPAPKPGDKPAAGPANKPGENKPNLPELPKGLTGLKIDQSKAVTKDGRVEHQFKFGDLNVPGTIIMPEKPGDGTKPTIMFNYVNDPSKFDQAKFLQTLQKSKVDLGNTVIVTIKTPEATTRVNKQQVDTMTQLMGEVEKFRADLLAKDPKYKDLKVPRAENLLHMCAQGEQTKVSSLLEAYQKAAAGKDPRVPVGNLPVIDTDPDQFAAGLEKALNPTAEPAPAETPATPDQTPGPDAQGGGGVMGGGGGRARGGSGGGSSSSGGGGESPSAETPAAASDTTTNPDTPKPTGNTESTDQSKTNPEVKAEGIDRVLILGDSLMELTQKKIAGHYKNNSIEVTAVRSKPLHQMLGELKARGGTLEKLNTEKCRGTIVVNGGVNDLAAGRTDVEIMADMKAMVAIAKQYNLKINFCALAPFGGTTYQSLQKDFKEKNDFRKNINTELYALAAVDGGTVGVIPLDKGKSKGGLADDNNPDQLDPDYAAKDGLHLSIGRGAGKDGTEAMAAAIEKYLGEPVTKAPDKTPAVGAPDNTETPDTPAVEPGKRLKAFRESSPQFDTWAAQTRKTLLDRGVGQEVYVKLEYKGKPLLGVLRPHTIIGATGEAAAPGTIGLETYEYDAEMDPGAQKKSPESVAKRIEPAPRSIDQTGSSFEKQQPLLNGEIEFALNAPKSFNPALPTELIVYATPNGQAPERTNGTGNQIGRQADLLRNSSADYRAKNLIIAYISPLSRKWEEYVGKNPAGGNQALAELTSLVRNRFHPRSLDISFDSHSGGGAFAFNIMNERNGIPAEVRHLDFFDSIYYYQGGKHAAMIKKWLDGNQENTFTLVAGTPPIIAKQKMLITDLERLGIAFKKQTDQNQNTEYTANNGRIKIKILDTADHGGTVTRNGFAYAHDPDGFEITNRAV